MLNAAPRIDGEEDFEAFCEFANRVEMDDSEFGRLKCVVHKHMPTKPLYVCTIKKLNIVKGKAKMVNISVNNKFFTFNYFFLGLSFVVNHEFHMQYFSKSFTMNHIVHNVELPADIQVYSRNRKIAKVKMVMSK